VKFVEILNRLFTPPLAIWTFHPPNPTVTRSVIGEQALVKSPLFPALSPRMDEGTIRYSIVDVISHRGTPRDARSQRSHTTKLLVLPDPRADTFLPRKGSGDGSQRFNHPRCDYCHDVQACSRPSQYQTMRRKLGSGNARAIITKASHNKTARGHAGTEASSRQAPYPYRGLF